MTTIPDVPVVVTQRGITVVRGAASMVHHAMTPHTGERFERDRRATVLTRDEFMRHLAAGLPMVIGRNHYEAMKR